MRQTEADCRKTRALRLKLPILGEATTRREPSDRAFNNPSFGQDGEASSGVGAFDDVHVDLSKDMANSAVEQVRNPPSA